MTKINDALLNSDDQLLENQQSTLIKNIVKARINLKGTIKDELLYTALIESAKNYKIKINEGRYVIVTKDGDGKHVFTVNTDKSGEIIELSMSTQMSNIKSDNLRVCLFRKANGQNGVAEIVITIDNPYRVKTEKGKYIIEHQIA